MEPKVTIIILNWNGLKDTIKCLQSLKKIAYSNYEIIVVDNGSSDGSVDFLIKEYPEVQLISNPQNLGYAGGNNVGISYSLEKGTDYVLLLNNDTVVDPNFLLELIIVAETDSKIAIVQSNIISFDGETEYSFYDKYGATFSRKSKIDSNENNDMEKPLLFYPCGACMLIRKAVLVEKFFDERLFAYYEDVDTGWKLRLRNYNICYARKSICYHEGSSSLKNNKPFKMYLIWRNRVRVLTKNYSFLNLLKRLPIALILEFSASIMYTIESKNIKYISMYFSGLYWNISNLRDTLHQRKIVQSTRIVKENQIESYMINSSLEFNSILNHLKI